MPVFSTMRSNLAMVDAFLRRSIIEEHNYRSEDLGFLGIASGELHIQTHNRSVTLVIVALLYQCLENYFDLTRISSRLEDPELQNYLNRLGSNRRFLDGMKKVRHGVFHVRSLRSWRRPSVRYFEEVCDKRGGVLAVMMELRGLLYDFTEKVFLGELRIWPDSVHEEMERLERARPDLIEKLESGEIDITEFLETGVETDNG